MGSDLCGRRQGMDFGFLACGLKSQSRGSGREWKDPAKTRKNFLKWKTCLGKETFTGVNMEAEIV